MLTKNSAPPQGGSQDAGTKHLSLSSRLHDLETAVYGSFQILQRKHVPHTTSTLIGVAIKFLQLAAFALSAHAGYNWHEDTVRPVQLVCELSTVPGYMGWLTPSAYLAIYYLAVAWVLVFLGLFLWATFSFMRQSWPVLWPLRVLAAMGSTSATILYIPLFYLLMSGFTCNMPEENHFWKDLGYQCYVGGHLAQTIITAVVVAFFVALCTLFTLVYFDSNPLSVSLSAKSHGRADFAFLVVKTALVVLAEVYAHAVGPNALAGIILASGILLLAVYGSTMPYNNHRMNKLMLAMLSAFTWIGLCVVVVQVYPELDAAVMVYAGCPVAALAGSGVADWRARHVFNTSAAQLSNVYDVDLKVRYFLHAAIWGDPIEERTDVMKLKMANSKPGATAERVGIVADPGAETMSANLDGIDDSEARVIQVRSLLQASTIKEAEALLKTGLARFTHSAVMHVFAARFYAIFSGNSHLQMSHLFRAERHDPPVDVRFLVFQARRQAEDGTGSKGQMSALNRVAFEKHLADAKKQVYNALLSQVAFWAELAELKPDVTLCHRLSSDMNASIYTAERAFQNLMELNSQSLIVLRLYADFTLYVVNNQERASVLIADAERIEDQQTKEHHRETGAAVRIMQQSNLDILADNTAVVTIGASYNNLGMIMSASPYTAKLFGYSRWQLERRNVSVLMPAPIADAHDKFLQNYLESGEGRMVDYTTVVFGLHRAGHIFPMLLCIREQPASDGPPAFVGIMRAISSSENHIIMTPDYVIRAASAASLTVLNVEAAALTGGDVKITSWVNEWEVMLKDLRKPKGASIRINGNNTATSNVNATLADRRPGTSPGLTASNEPDTWIRGFLQDVPLPNGASMVVLHWSRLATDSFTIANAEKRRRASLTGEDHVQLSTTMSPAQYLRDTVQQAAGEAHQHRKGTPRFSTPLRESRGTPLPSWHPTVEGSAGGRGCPASIKVNVFGQEEEEGNQLDRQLSGFAPSPAVEPAQSMSPDFADPRGEVEHSSSEPLMQAPIIAVTSPAKRVSIMQPPADSKSVEGTDSLDGIGSTSVDEPRHNSSSDAVEKSAFARAVSPRPRFSNHPEKTYEETVAVAEHCLDVVDVAPQLASPARSSPHPQGGEKASQASSRRTAAKRVQDRLRKVLAENNNKLLPGLTWLRAVGIMIVLVTACLGIAIAVVISNDFSLYSTVIAGCTQAQAILAFGILATQHIRYFSLCDLIVCGAADDAHRRPIIKSSAISLSSSLRSLYETSKSIGYHMDYETVNVPVIHYEQNLTAGGLVSYFTQESLMESGLELSTAALKISTLPITNMTRGQRDVEFTINNAFKDGGIHDALNATIFSWLSNSHALGQSIYDTSSVVYYCMIAMVNLMGLCIVLPILMYIDKMRDRYLMPFIQLPAVVAAKLRENAEKRLRQLRANVREDDESGSDQSEDDDAASGAGDFEGGGEDEADWGALIQADQIRSRRKDGKARRDSAAVSPTGAAVVSSRAFKKSPKSLLLLMARFTLPLLLVLAFFSVLFVETSASLRKIKLLQAYSAIAGQRDLEVRELTAITRALLSTRGSRKFVMKEVVLINKLMDSAEFHHNLLTFIGGPMADPLLDTVSRTDLSTMMSAGDAAVMNEGVHVNACTFITAYPQTYTAESCTAFRGGVLTTGLHNAMADMLQLGRALVARRASADVPLNSTAGNGFMTVGTEVVPYSLIAETTSQDLKDFIVYSNFYIPPALARYTNMIDAAVTAEVERIQGFLVTFVAGFVVIFSVYQLSFYFPSVHKTNMEIKAERAMMLLVPHGVLTSFAPLQKLVSEMVEVEESRHSSKL